MNQPLAGPGLGLPVPQNLYPSELNNASYDAGTNRVTLPPGSNLPFPAGDWWVSAGGYLVIQYKDPITGAWSFGSGAAYNRIACWVKSDGFNVRLANLTACPVAAAIFSTQAAAVQATTTITVTPATQGSTWAPIVGGGLSASVINVGAGYGVAPLAIIPAPPPFSSNPNGVGGVCASGYASIASGTVVAGATGFTFTNIGAGYPTAPANLALLPTPTDPNIASGITLATVAFSLTSASVVLAALCTNNGTALATPSAITLTVNGAGTTSASCVVMQTITAATVSGAGIGYGTGATAVLAVGGVPPQGTINNSPDFKYLAWFPRPVDISVTGANTSVSVGSPGVVYDGGLFLSAPTAVWPPAVGAATTVGTVAFVMGSAPDIAVIQPAP